MKNIKPWVLLRQIAIVLVAGLATVYWATRDRGSPLQSFCSDIKIGTHYDLVLSSAETAGFSVPFYAKEDERITIFNKKGMLFEYGCSVQFRNSMVVGSTFFEK